MEKEQLNIGLRAEVLKRALEIEDAVNQIMFDLLKVKKTSTMTLSGKSSSLSFKSKIDLLCDLERINKDEHRSFLLFMEIRNQLLHNLEANTLSKVLERLGKDKKNRLLKLIGNDSNGLEEDKYMTCFKRLYLDLIGLIIKIKERILKDYEDELDKEYKLKAHDNNQKVLGYIGESIDETFDIMNEVLGNVFPSGYDNEKSKIGNKFRNVLLALLDKKLKTQDKEE